MLLAVPMGRLADRIGRGRVLLGGYALLLARLRRAAVAARRLAARWSSSLGLLGAYYAATDGVLMALGSAVVPEEVRGSGLALLGTATSIARLVASVAFGALWTVWGIDVAFACFGVALVAAGALAAVVLAPHRGSSPVSSGRRWLRLRAPAGRVRRRGRRGDRSRRSRAGDHAAASTPGARGALAGAQAERRPVVVFRSLRGRARRRPGRSRSPAWRTPPAAGRSGRCAATASTSRAATASASPAAAASPRATRRRSSAPTCASAARGRVAGVPSRARVSPDGRYGSVTLFVTGHSYADRGRASRRRRR